MLSCSLNAGATTLISMARSAFSSHRRLRMGRHGAFWKCDGRHTPVGAVENHRTAKPLHVSAPDVHGRRVQPRDAALRDSPLEDGFALRRPAGANRVLEVINRK